MTSQGGVRYSKACLPAVVCAGLVAFAIATAGSAGACPFEGPPVEQPDNVFMSELESTEIQGLPREEAIGFANSVCDALAGDATPLGVAAATSDFTPMDMDESKVFVAVAVGAYCPEYAEMVSAEFG